MNMQIKHLAERYFEGNTSLSEEILFRKYLSETDDGDPEMAALKRQFNLYESLRTMKPDEQLLNDRILVSIENSASATPVKKTVFRRWMVAASFLLLMGAGILYLSVKNNDLKDTYSDPNLAYVETRKALLLVSASMNKGIEPLSNINKINSSTQELQNINKLDKSLEMLQLVSFINHSSNMKK